jgi:uncharacterized protein (TIGR02996 family)
VRPVDIRPELDKPMLVLEVRERERTRTVSFSRTTLGLGFSVPTLVIGESLGLTALDPRHAELFERDGRLHLVSHRETTLDGRSTAKPLAKKLTRRERNAQRARGDVDAWVREPVVSVGSVIGIGDVAIVVTHFASLAPPDVETVEREFLVALERDHASMGSRLVYADALEERGWLIRAEYLRLQLRLLLGEPIAGDEDALKRYEKKLLAAPKWKQRIGEPMVADRCGPQLGRACPIAWGGTPQPTACPKCERVVQYALSVARTRR